MATSLVVPLAYITVLVTSLAIFSRVYRRRKLGKRSSLHPQTKYSYSFLCLAAVKSWEPWFPKHPARDIYISLVTASSSEPAEKSKIPLSMLKSALLVRATADVKRIWRIRDDKMALASLHNRGLVGDDTMARFAAAEKELEAEIVDVISEANTFRQGWGQMIFQTATEMAQAERTREVVLNIPRVKVIEGERTRALDALLLSQSSCRPQNGSKTQICRWARSNSRRNPRQYSCETRSRCPS